MRSPRGAQEEQRRIQAQRIRRAILDHFGSVGKPESCKELMRGPADAESSRLAAGTDEVARGGGRVRDEDAKGASPDPKLSAGVDSVSKGHPGPRLRRSDINPHTGAHAVSGCCIGVGIT